MPTRAKDIMTAPVIVIRDDASLEDAARLMLERKVGGLAVVDAEGLVVGFVTDSDFAPKEHGIPFSLVHAPQLLGQWLGREGVERIYEAARDRPVGEVMSKPAVTVEEDAPIEMVLRKLLRHDINRVVVARGRTPVGIVARHDLLRLMLDGPGTR